MSKTIYLNTPISDEDLAKLETGDQVYITGIIYTARDAAHKRLVALLDAGQELPFDPKGAIIYYVGPSPAPPGKPIGSAGPTTSYRMDTYSPALLDAGVKVMVGKGGRSQEVIDSMIKNKAVYLAAIGGAGVVIANSIKKAEVIAYADLGTEAIRKLEVEDFPCIVANDIKGNDVYEQAIKKYGVK
jgi:fumarate hydratase subunit beta